MFIKTFKEQYPSRLECFLVYPSNFIFNAIWALVKPFLDAKSKGSAFLLSSKVGGAGVRAVMRGFLAVSQAPSLSSSSRGVSGHIVSCPIRQTQPTQTEPN